MPEYRVTSVDVARAAGVSQPTVSRVITGGSNVTPELSRRVKEAARALGYRPNMLARAMNQGKSNVIGVVVAYLDNPFYAEALENLSIQLKSSGYRLLLFIASNDVDSADLFVEDLIAHQVDGIILASVSTTLPLTKEIVDASIPLVLFNRAQANKDIPAVTASNYAGGRKAARFLLERGHRQIAHISGWQGSQTGLDRMHGFLAGLEEAAVEPIAVVDSYYDRERAMQATRDLFTGGKKPDAIFAGNDHMAIAVIEALRHDLGLRVPEDVSVIGFDDIKMAAWRDYSLTTLRQPANRLVQATVDLLMTLIDGRKPDRLRVEIESELIQRGSVRARG